MGWFDQVHTVPAEVGDPGIGSLIIAEAGVKTGDIIRKAMAATLTVPLGSRPSVGAGLWLQGGIGQLARLHGLACHAIVGAVMVSGDSGEILYVGHVPIQHRPAGFVRPTNDTDILWAIKGAGTNFGIVISVAFRSYSAPTYLVRSWNLPLDSHLEAERKVKEFDQLIARKLPRNCSTDAYLYWDTGRLHLGVTTYEVSTVFKTFLLDTQTPADTVLGHAADTQVVDAIGLFETEMYISGMHGGHGGGKTCSFKRCVFFKDTGSAHIVQALVNTMEKTRPSLCYLHLLHGGGAVEDVAADATAFGCRSWDFACVVTGVWLRDQDGGDMSQQVQQWVYDVVNNLLALSAGVYPADLGPDPRDAALAVKAFGPNRPRLARLKKALDPHNVMAYACPLPREPIEPKLIILITGEHGAGKDYCAQVWTSVFAETEITARSVSIGDVIKRKYAAAVGADLGRLLRNRPYKEEHRPALTAFFQEQVRQQPRLPEEQFLSVVYGADDVNVLLITGMRDEAPVATFSHLVPDSKVIEVCVRAGKEIRQSRRGTNNDSSVERVFNYVPDFIFVNNTPGDQVAKIFAAQHLLPFIDGDLRRLESMVRLIPDFPRQGIDFRHVLGIAQQPGGIALCTSLFRNHFTCNWADVDAIVCCEAGGFLLASALAFQVEKPLVLVRKAGKLPLPTVSVVKGQSHISGSSCGSEEERVEIEQDAIPEGASVVVVDDVLATGRTLCAVLSLLKEVGVDEGRVSVIEVAEFPVHCGRRVLREEGFGKVRVQSLLVFGGV